MGQYTVYCNGSQNLKNLSGGVGELRIDNLGADKADWGWLFFDKSPVPSGEVLDSASVLAVYCHAPYPLSLILGQIAGPSWNGPEWKITSGGVRGAGNLVPDRHYDREPDRLRPILGERLGPFALCDDPDPCGQDNAIRLFPSQHDDQKKGFTTVFSGMSRRRSPSTARSP